MRIRTKVITKSGGTYRPAGSVFDLSDDQAGKMIADGAAEPAESVALPVSGSSIPSAASVTSVPAGSGAREVPATGATNVSNPEFDDAADFFRELGATDAIAYVESTEQVELLRHLESIERDREQPRKTVLAAIERQVEQFSQSPQS